MTGRSAQGGVRVLGIEGCPNAARTVSEVEQALRELGLGRIPVDSITVRSAEEAERTGFAGSPTVQVGGRDLFPDAPRTLELACRVYRQQAGVGGSPDPRELREALRSVLAGRDA